MRSVCLRTKALLRGVVAALLSRVAEMFAFSLCGREEPKRRPARKEK
jgi:hypothetical protein